MAAIHQSTLLVLVISLQSVIRAVAQQQPTISHISQAKTVNIGDTVDLDCSVQYAYDFPVLWVKVSRLIVLLLVSFPATFFFS